MFANLSDSKNASNQRMTLGQSWVSNQVRSILANWRTNGRMAKSAQDGLSPNSHGLAPSCASKSNKNSAAPARASEGSASGYRVAYFVRSRLCLNGPSQRAIQSWPSGGMSCQPSGSCCANAQAMTSRLSSITRSPCTTTGTVPLGLASRNAAALSRRTISRKSHCTPADWIARRARMA